MDNQPLFGPGLKPFLIGFAALMAVAFIYGSYKDHLTTERITADRELLEQYQTPGQGAEQSRSE